MFQQLRLKVTNTKDLVLTRTRERAQNLKEVTARARGKGTAVTDAKDAGGVMVSRNAQPPMDDVSDELREALNLQSTLERCPPLTEFGGETSGLLNVDTNEGCRVTITKGGRLGGGVVSGTYSLNLGTYAPLGSQGELIRALLDPKEASRLQVGRGGADWGTSIRHSTNDGGLISHFQFGSKGNAEFSARSQLPHSCVAKTTLVTNDARQFGQDAAIALTNSATALTQSLTQGLTQGLTQSLDQLRNRSLLRTSGPAASAKDGTDMAPLTGGTAVTGTAVTSGTATDGTAQTVHAGAGNGGAGGSGRFGLSKISSKIGWPSVTNLPTLPFKDTTAIVSLERATPQTNFCSSFLANDNAQYLSGGWATRISKKLCAGVDMTLLTPTNVMIMNQAVRYRSESGDLHAAAVLNTSPDFSKSVHEGFYSPVYALKLNAMKKMNERLTVAGDVEVPVSRPPEGSYLENLVGRVGYEIQYPQTRIAARFGTDLKLEQKIMDASGLHVSGTLDFPNNNYKVGFGIDYSI